MRALAPSAQPHSVAIGDWTFSGIVADVAELANYLADRLGCKDYFPYVIPDDIFRELAAASKGGSADYSGMTYAKIEKNMGVFWPCPAEIPFDTIVLFVFLPRWIIFVPVSACWRLLVVATE